MIPSPFNVIDADNSALRRALYAISKYAPDSVQPYVRAALAGDSGRALLADNIALRAKVHNLERQLAAVHLEMAAMSDAVNAEKDGPQNRDIPGTAGSDGDTEGLVDSKGVP